jgi:hypothetical protein
MTKKVSSSAWVYSGGAEAVEVHFSSGVVTFTKGAPVDCDQDQAEVLGGNPEFAQASAAPTPKPTDEEAK